MRVAEELPVGRVLDASTLPSSLLRSFARRCLARRSLLAARLSAAVAPRLSPPPAPSSAPHSQAMTTEPRTLPIIAEYPPPSASDAKLSTVSERDKSGQREGAATARPTRLEFEACSALLSAT